MFVGGNDRGSNPTTVARYHPLGNCINAQQSGNSSLKTPQFTSISELLRYCLATILTHGELSSDSGIFRIKCAHENVVNMGIELSNSSSDTMSCWYIFGTTSGQIWLFWGGLKRKDPFWKGVSSNGHCPNGFWPPLCELWTESNLNLEMLEGARVWYIVIFKL